jgi:Ca2+-binding RTX toxin-like protein
MLDIGTEARLSALMTGEQVTTIETSGAADAVFSPMQDRLYVSLGNGTIDVFDVISHAKIATWRIGSALGPITVSTDGSFLLAADPRQPLVYKIDTATGERLATYLGNGSNYLDIEIVDEHTALFSGDRPAKLNLDDGTMTSLDGTAFYSGRSILSEDDHLTLFAETGISNGPLAIYDDRVGQVVARGDNYQSSYTGFNFGIQAISESAGLVLQFIYYQSINIYDLSLKYLRTINLGQPLSGLVFDESGSYVYAYFGSDGRVVKYEATTFNVVDEYNVQATQWTGGSNSYGNQLLISDDSSHLIVLDPAGGAVQIVDLPNDAIKGTAGDDALFGTDQNDILNGLAGADRMSGGLGDDRYVVDDPGDRAIERAGEGDDIVVSSITYRLGANVEGLTLAGTAAIGGTGNVLANTVTGNDAANTLNGHAGDDVLIGGAGDDILIGGFGNDTMRGGLGNDSYRVDAVGDTVVELGGEGYDTVVASINYTLGDNVEKLGLIGLARVGTGNALDNLIVGGGGADTLSGLDGNDSIQGNDGADKIDGGAGDDLLYGGLGRDVLTGGAGADRFVFRPDDAGNTAQTADRILDFSHAEGDRISLAAIDANDAAPGSAFVFVGSAAFSGTAGELRYSAFGGDTLIEGDTNGDGIADLAIRLTGNVALVVGDFAL